MHQQQDVKQVKCLGFSQALRESLLEEFFQITFQFFELVRGGNPAQ